MNKGMNIAFDADIISYWRAHVKMELVRKATSEKFRQIINEVNVIIQKVNNRFKFDTRTFAGGGNYITNDIGNNSVTIYAILSVYPTNETTMIGPFSIVLSENNTTYSINLDKVESVKQLAEIILTCLLHPNEVMTKYVRHGILIPNIEARRKLINQYEN